MKDVNLTFFKKHKMMNKKNNINSEDSKQNFDPEKFPRKKLVYIDKNSKGKMVG